VFALLSRKPTQTTFFLCVEGRYTRPLVSSTPAHRTARLSQSSVKQCSWCRRFVVNFQILSSEASGYHYSDVCVLATERGAEAEQEKRNTLHTKKKRQQKRHMNVCAFFLFCAESKKKKNKKKRINKNVFRALFMSSLLLLVSTPSPRPRQNQSRVPCSTYTAPRATRCIRRWPPTPLRGAPRRPDLRSSPACSHRRR
jgi:hypothetical protein